MLPFVHLLAGSADAMRILRTARWYGGSSASENERAVCPSVAHKLDVVMVNAVTGRTVPDHAWCMDGLANELGFKVIRRSSVIVDKTTERVMAVFITGHDFPDVGALSKRLSHLHASLDDTMNKNSLRPGIRMFGYRWNVQGHCNPACRGNMRTGYYPGANLMAARHLWQEDGGDAQRVVVGSASALCNIERSVSPSMAARRMSHAKMSGHPGIWPGTSHVTCPAPTLGVSMGYVSPPHVDYSYADIAETIAWSSKGVPAGSGYSFAVTDAGVVFDLLSHRGTACMVPGSIMHGTPRLNRGFPEKHPGIGMVVLNKANLLSDEAKTDSVDIVARLQHKPSNPFVQGFYRMDPSGMQCELCNRDDRADEIIICDNCHLGFHVGCCQIRRSLTASDAEWLCHSCAAL